MDSDWRKFVSEENCRHSHVQFDSLRRSELVSLEKWTLAIRGLVKIVNLTNLEEVVDHQSGRATKHGKLSTVSHEFGLINIPTIQFEIEFLVEVSLDCFGVVEISKAQVVDFVCKIKFMTRHVKSLDGLWVMMT